MITYLLYYYVQLLGSIHKYMKLHFQMTNQKLKLLSFVIASYLLCMYWKFYAVEEQKD